MALDKAAFKDGLKGLLESINSEEDGEAYLDKYCDGITDLVAALVLSATPTGTVNTTGTAAAQTGQLLNGKLI
jgi:hypothetical protein